MLRRRVRVSTAWCDGRIPCTIGVLKSQLGGFDSCSLGAVGYGGVLHNIVDGSNE